MKIKKYPCYAANHGFCVQCRKRIETVDDHYATVNDIYLCKQCAVILSMATS